MISVVLIEPETSGNIGAVARVMKNFDFTNLVLINPKCNHLDGEAIQRSKHAAEILEKATIGDFSHLDSYDYLIATTSKLGTDYNIPRSPLSPEQLAEKIKDKDTNIALVFGREGNGLYNEEIQKCDFTVSIPSSKEYPALNLSHSVGIMLYELHKALKMETITDHFIIASKKEKVQILKLLNQVLEKIEFSTEEKQETQKIVWKRIFGKAMLTKREAFAVMGFLKKLL